MPRARARGSFYHQTVSSWLHSPGLFSPKAATLCLNSHCTSWSTRFHFQWLVYSWPATWTTCKSSILRFACIASSWWSSYCFSVVSATVTRKSRTLWCCALQNFTTSTIADLVRSCSLIRIHPSLVCYLDTVCQTTTAISFSHHRYFSSPRLLACCSQGFSSIVSRWLKGQLTMNSSWLWF